MIRVLTFLVLLSYFCHAKENILTPTRQLSISEGLGHNGVTDIFEDSRGFVWIATYDGLNRYDGYSFKIFKNSLNEKKLVSNRVRSIVEDEKGNLWLGTDDGISIYNYALDRFETIYSKKSTAISGPVVRKILIDRKRHQIICATEKEGLLIFNQDYTLDNEHYPFGYSFSTSISLIDGIFADEETLLFASSVGIIQYDLASKEFKKILNNKIWSSSAIVKVSNSRFMATAYNGVIFFSYENGRPDEDKVSGKRLPSYRFNNAEIDPMGNLWLTSLNKGLLKIKDVNDLQEGEPIESSFFVPKLGNIRASCVFTSLNSGCWFGSFDKGVYRFRLKENPFAYVQTEMGLEHSFSNSFILSLNKIDNNRILIKTHEDPLTIFNTLKGRFEQQPSGLIKSLGDSINLLYEDSRGFIWLHLKDKGFCRAGPGSGHVEEITQKYIPNIEFYLARGILEDQSGNIWFGDWNNGLFRISIDRHGKIGKIESFKDHSYFNKKNISQIRKMYYDARHNIIWIGTDVDGLYRLNLSNHDESIESIKVDHYSHIENNPHSLSSNFISSILRLPNNELWIGTERGGICRMVEDGERPKFQVFAEEHGLSNNVVKDILFDSWDESLWVTTNIGLNKFDLSSNSFRVFREEDGLPFEDFSFGSIILDNGNIVLTSEHGLCYFEPKRIETKIQAPRLMFDGFKIRNKIVLPGDSLNGRVVLNQILELSRSLSLKHDENIFSIDVKSLHYSNVQNNKISYRLLPNNEEWIESFSDEGQIKYNGLAPGEYTLEVRASNSLNQWSVKKDVKIIISPPFWKTTWAYILYVIVALLILAAIVLVILRIQALNHGLQIEHMEVENVKEVNASKLRFFSNISHEIKTPLTLINSPVSLLLSRKQISAEVREVLDIVHRQTKKIFQLVEQVHDFQKTDANALKMNYTNFNFSDFINSLLKEFEFIAHNESKILHFDKSLEDIHVSADREKLEKILNNLISNAFKYTDSGDRIVVECRYDENDLIIDVSDSGMGIDQEDLPHIFERFYQSRKKNEVYSSGSGIGLAFTKRLVEMHYGYIGVESELNKGTKITVKLPVVCKAAKQFSDEIEKRILNEEEKHEVLLINNVEGVNSSELILDSEYRNSSIFFVEDNTDMRNYVTKLLSDFFKVKAFVHGQECLDALEKEWPTVVVSDVMMPKMNGLELCKRIKSDIRTSHIPVILLTACNTIDEQIKGINQGADAYVSKPFNAQHLLSTIEALLKKRKQLLERFQIDIPLEFDKNQSKSKDHAFLEKLYSLMSENLDNQDLEISDFAKELCLSRTPFFQKVKALTNQTPNRLLQTYRLKKAAELLVSSDFSLNEISANTGFKSRSHFHKSFKDKYGMTPTAYSGKRGENVN